MQRRGTLQTRRADPEERAFHKWLKERDCCACGARGPGDVHHCAGSTARNNGVLIGHWFCLALCRRCHDLRHGRKHVFLQTYARESTLWFKAALDYHRETEAAPPAEVTSAIMTSGR